MGRRAPNCMAGRTRTLLKKLCPGARCLGRRGALLRDPGLECFGGIDDQAEPHLGVLHATELDTLPREFTGLLRREPEPVRSLWHYVALPAHLRHPEAVDDIG